MCIYSICVYTFQNLHTKTVRQYKRHYKDNPPTSGDEECLYWIRFLTYHMAKANLSQVERFPFNLFTFLLCRIVDFCVQHLPLVHFSV